MREFGEVTTSDEKNWRPVLGATKVMVTAVIMAELAAFLIYSVIEPENLMRRLIVTGVIASAVAFPIGYYITNQKRKLAKLSRELAYIASMDQMSGLLNRSTFMHAVDEQLHTPKAGATAGSFLFVDVDHFKSLNDRFGHAVGDDTIKAIGEVIRDFKDQEVVAGRIGGEEFGVFVPNANKKAAISIAENLRRKVRKIVVKDEKNEQKISVSIGISMHKAGQSLTEVVKKADECMYQAKAEGRNRVIFEDLAQKFEVDAEIADAKRTA